MNNFDLSAFNPVDALLVAIVLLGVMSGFRRGFLLSTLQLLTLAASLVVAFLTYHYPEAWLKVQAPSLGLWTAPLSFFATYIAVHLVISGIAGSLARAFPQHAHAHGLNRTLGMLPGFVNGLINATLASLLLLTLPLIGGLSGMTRESQLASQLSAPAEWLEAKLSPIFHPAINQTMQSLTVPQESKATVKLGYSVLDPKARPDLEARMLEMINNERAEQGLSPLQADPEMAEVARAHSRDMFARSYFSHLSPEGLEPFERMRKAKVRFLNAGENLALAQTLPSAHQGLMNSPGHRANILRASYGRVGIGILDGGRYGLMVTQNFRN